MARISGGRATGGPGTETARHEGTASVLLCGVVAGDTAPARRLPAMRALQDVARIHAGHIGAAPARRLPAMRALQVGVGDLQAHYAGDRRHGDCPP